AAPRRRQRRRRESGVVARDAARETHPQPPRLVERQRVGGRGVLAEQARGAVEVAQHHAPAAGGRGVAEEDAGGGAQPEPAARVLADGDRGARVDAAFGADAVESEWPDGAVAAPRADQAAAAGADPEVAVPGCGEAVEVLARQPVGVRPGADARRGGALVAESGQAAATAGE